MDIEGGEAPAELTDEQKHNLRAAAIQTLMELSGDRTIVVVDWDPKVGSLAMVSDKRDPLKVLGAMEMAKNHFITSLSMGERKNVSPIIKPPHNFDPKVN